MTEKITKNKKIIYAALITITVIQVTALFFVFTFLKQGHHSDEVWNYAFANSYESGTLDVDNNGYTTFNRWHSAEVLKDYITVDKEHRFAYSANIRNAANDLNPPFQYMVLHTISSFFPGVFSWYFCFAINIAAFVVSQIFIFKLTSKITNNNLAGIAAIVLYGFGVGAMDVTIFMRIYALAVMFVAVFAYCSHMVCETGKEKIRIKYLIPLFVSCFLGAYTLHVFLMVAFVITLCYEVYYLFTKKFKVFFIHGLTCLVAALLTLVLVPNTFKHVGGINEQHSFSSVSYPFFYDLRLYLYSLTKDLFGVHVISYPNVYFVSFLVILLFICIMLTPIVFLVRREAWFVKFKDKLKEKAKNVIDARKGFKFTLIALFLAIVGTSCVVAKWTSYFYMKEYANRYIFVLYPITIVLGVSLAYFVLHFTVSNNKAVAISLIVICVILTTLTHFMTGSRAYLFEHEEEGITFNDLGQDARSVIVLWEDWIITCFAPDLYKTDAYFATNYFNFKVPFVFDDADPDKEYYLIVDQHYILPDDMTYEEARQYPYYEAAGENLYSEDDFLQFYRDLDTVDKVEYIGKDAEYGRIFKIYKVFLTNESQ